jgi:threonine dehydratase
MLAKIEMKDLVEARDRIGSFIHRTPILRSKGLNEMVGAEVFFKCENFQKGGSFKTRGASNAVFSLSYEALKNGVTTHSSGNHAQALAIAAKDKNARAHIVMPSDSSKVKIEAVKAYGGEITFSEPDLRSREETLDLVKNKTGATFIHPYDNDKIISGQSTCAQEILEELDENPDFLLAPVGGGGLLSGTALASHFFSHETKVIGCEPSLASDAYEGFHKKEWVSAKPPITIADGLRTALGRRNFEIILKHVEEILLVEEEEIKEAMKILWERLKVVVEPSGAVPFAALLKNKEKFQGKRVALILSGGNVDLSKVGDFF